MKIEFLGTGGALPIPRPGCACAICTEARARGVPYSRSGPSLFIHGPGLLIDTPEEIGTQLNRAHIFDVPHCLYSHWHPDHIMGRRVWEMNFDWGHWPPQHRVTNIYLPQRVAVDFKERLGMWEHLSYLQELGVVRLLVLSDGETVVVDDTQVYPFRLAVDYVYGFLLVQGETRVFIAPDELFGWDPPELVRGVDVAVIPKGIQEFNPFTGERQIPAEHPVLKSEATFRQTLQMVRHLQAQEVVMTHIEEADRLSYEDLLRLEEQLQQEGFNIRFAYDTMVLELPSA